MKDNCYKCGSVIYPHNDGKKHLCAKCKSEIADLNPNKKYRRWDKCPMCGGLKGKGYETCRPCLMKKRSAVRVSLESGVIPEGIHCRKCGVLLTKENWPEIAWRYGAVNYRCYTCYRKRANIILNRQYPKIAEKQRKLKREVVDHYGGECECCHEKNIGFLSIDHINNDGGERRKKKPAEFNIYRWAKMHDYPSDLRVLCYNCNMGRSKHGGICPHEIARREAAVSNG